MEPDSHTEQPEGMDTGQTSSSSVSMVTLASAPVEASAGDCILNNEACHTDPTISVSVSDRKSDEFLVEFGVTSSTCDSHNMLELLTTNSFEVTPDHKSKGSYAVKPKICVGMEDEDAREVESSNDEDMDPLITVDETESQSSDLINFDTVSYDVIHQLDGDEDDDEKSVATISSLSCDIKMDSPIQHSGESNSSSLLNLLDSSVKETLNINPSLSAHVSTEGIESTESSCPSSPSFQSSQTASSVMDDSISEACTNLLPVSKDKSGCSSDEFVCKPKSFKHEAIPVCSEDEAFGSADVCNHLVQHKEISHIEKDGYPVNLNDSSSCQAFFATAADKRGSWDLQETHHLPSDLLMSEENICNYGIKELEEQEDKSTVLVYPLTLNQNNIKTSGLTSVELFPAPLDSECTLMSNLLNTSDQEIRISASEDDPIILSEIASPVKPPSEGSPCSHVISSTGSLPDCSRDDIVEDRTTTLDDDNFVDGSGVGSVAHVCSISPNAESQLHTIHDSCSPIDLKILDEEAKWQSSILQGNTSINASSQISQELFEERLSPLSTAVVTGEITGPDAKILRTSISTSQITDEERGILEVVMLRNDTLVSLTTDESSQLTSCDISNESTELHLVESPHNIDLSREERLCEEITKPSHDETFKSKGFPNQIKPNSSEATEAVNEKKAVECAENEDCVPFPNLVQDEKWPDESGKSESMLSKVDKSVIEDGALLGHCVLKTFSSKASSVGIWDKALCEASHDPGESHVVTATELTTNSCECDRNCGCQTGKQPKERSTKNCPLEDSITKAIGVSQPSIECSMKSSQSYTMPDIESMRITSSGSSSWMNFSEFLDLNIATNSPKPLGKQYSVTALDEAQQTATCLVDNVLRMAVLKAEETMSFSRSNVKSGTAFESAQSAVNDVLTKAQVLLETGGAQNASASNRVHSKYESSAIKTFTGDLAKSNCDIKQETDLGRKNLLLLVSNADENEIEEECSFTSFLSKSVAVSNTVCEDNLPKASLDTVNFSEESSLSESSADVCMKEESVRSSSLGCTSDCAMSTSLKHAGLQSEASLFVNGVLEVAAKMLEESTSSESSPLKIQDLNIDSDYQGDDELATPCGEMLTEHFMDFESGRNVSVFCSIPDNSSEDHLMAYDRVANTIGNREVDSDTGKSVSVFRIEEDVFYEIQRASTCTSVFESVEEEDEDMIDTTVPVENRSNKNSCTSISSSDSTSEEGSKMDNDAFEDAVGAFLSKERLNRNETQPIISLECKEMENAELGSNQLTKRNTCRALVLKHPEYDISNQEEKKRMAEKWANGGELAVPDTSEMREKQRDIREALDSNEDVADIAVKLCQLALTEGGLINDSLRKEAWPRMLGLDPTLEIDAPLLEELKSHPEYGQVVLDVNRSLKRFPPDIPKDQWETLQDKLTRLIMYVISKHPHLRYYQGYHDVAVTFLLVVGESVAFQIMERLSTEHLSDCMQPTMERTSYLLHFIYPLLHRLHPTLADYLERSEVGTMFCLPWFLTWFGHSLDRYQDVVRLYDHFLASPPLAPLYVAAVLVAHRADEVLAVDCDMAAIHALLSHIPDSLPLEILLHDATDLYLKFPPESIEREVEERFKNEQEVRVHEVEAREKLQRHRALRRRRVHSTGSGSWQLAEFQDRIGGTMMVLNRWMPPWVVQQQRLSMRLLFASATFFVGFYVYSRGGDMLPYL